MTASLPMYNRPELRAAHEQYWHNIHNALKTRGITSPLQLDNDGFGLPFWTSQNLVLSQTCGMPYRKYLHDRVKMVGTPDYEVNGCPPGYYCSHFVVRRNDARQTISEFTGSIFAFNETDSQSGYAAAWNHLSPKHVWFENTRQTGAHLKSAEAVAKGVADIASIDAVTWRFAQEYDAFAAELRILETTQPTPGLPYITGMQHYADAIFDAVNEALTQTDPIARTKLGIRKILRIAKSEYLKIPNPQVTKLVTE